MTTENPNHRAGLCAEFREAYLAAHDAPVDLVERGRLHREALVAHDPRFREAFASLPELAPLC